MVERSQSNPIKAKGDSIIITYRMRAEIAELSKRSQIGPDEQSVEDICAIHVASFRNWSGRLTKVAGLRKDGQVGAGGIRFEQEATKVTKGGNASTAIWDRTTESDQIVGPEGNTENMFTGEGTEIIENNREKRERFGRSAGKLAGFAKEASQDRGQFLERGSAGGNRGSERTKPIRPGCTIS